MNSKQTKHLYDKDYFLNHVEGHKDFKSNKISKYKQYFVNLTDVEGKNILDIGCGRGELLQLCYDRSANLCVGIDYSSDAIELAQKFCDLNIILYDTDIENIDRLPFYEFDIIFMIDILEHISDEEAATFIKKIENIIAKKCQLIIATPIDIRRGDYKGMHINQWNENKIDSFFRDLFFSIDYFQHNGQICCICKNY